MKQLIAILISILAVSPANCQYNSGHNMVWTFGYRTGLDFRFESPMPISSGYDNTLITEGCASVCDKLGNLLFYSKGKEVYNRDHVLMPSSPAVPTTF